jgi:hypothetical protein
MHPPLLRSTVISPISFGTIAHQPVPASVSDGKCGASLVMKYAIIITNSISHHHMAYTNILEASGENRELFSTPHVLASSHPPIITIYLEASLLIIFTLIHIYVFGGLTSGITKYIALCRACTVSPLL